MAVLLSLAFLLAAPIPVHGTGRVLLPSWGVDNSLPANGPGFQADYESISRMGDVVESERGRIYVGRSGRARIDSPGDPAIALVWEGDRGVMLDLANGRPLLRFPLDDPELVDHDPMGAGAPSEVQESVAPDIVREDIGHRQIEGLACTGSRTTMTLVLPSKPELGPQRMTVETWVADALGQVVLEERRSADYEATLRLSRIEIREPDPRLFEPATATVLDKPAR